MHAHSHWQCTYYYIMQAFLHVPNSLRPNLQIQTESCDDNERKPLLHGSSGSVKGSFKKSGTAARRRHVHFSETNTKQEVRKGSQLPHKDYDVRCNGPVKNLQYSE